MRSVALAALAIAATPALDILDREPAFSETRFFAGLAEKDGDVRDCGQDINLVELTVGIQAINAYSDRPRQDAGILVGAGLMGRYWRGDEKGVRYDAAAPIIAVDLGGYLKPAKSIRFDAYGEAGAGVAFARTEVDGDDSETTAMRPFPHLAAHLLTTVALSAGSQVGLDISYDWDRLPDITVSGPGLALVFQLQLGGGAAKAD